MGRLRCCLQCQHPMSGASLNVATLLPIQVLDNALGKAEKEHKYLGPCHQCGKPGWSSWILPEPYLDLAVAAI